MDVRSIVIPAVAQVSAVVLGFLLLRMVGTVTHIDLTTDHLGYRTPWISRVLYVWGGGLMGIPLLWVPFALFLERRGFAAWGSLSGWGLAAGLIVLYGWGLAGAAGGCGQ